MRARRQYNKTIYCTQTHNHTGICKSIYSENPKQLKPVDRLLDTAAVPGHLRPAAVGTVACLYMDYH